MEPVQPQPPSASTTPPSTDATALPSRAANSALPSRIATVFGVVVDTVELWAIDSGLLDQVAFVVSKTALVRSLLLAAASSTFGVGVVKGEYTEILLGAAVAVAVGTVNSAIAHVRNKYARQVQAAVGAHPDKFVGPETVAQLRGVVAVATSQILNRPL